MQVQFQSNSPVMPRSTTATPRKTTDFAAAMASTAQKVAASASNSTASTRVRVSMADYLEWEKQRGPQTLPESKGWTEENIQYLRERYPGELSIYERIEALSTMADMGCITPEQYREAIGSNEGLQETAIVRGELRATTRPLTEMEMLPNWAPYLPTFDWAAEILNAPVSRASSLDDLFELLDQLGNN